MSVEAGWSTPRNHDLGEALQGEGRQPGTGRGCVVHQSVFCTVNSDHVQDAGGSFRDVTRSPMVDRKRGCSARDGGKSTSITNWFPVLGRRLSGSYEGCR